MEKWLGIEHRVSGIKIAAPMLSKPSPDLGEESYPRVRDPSSAPSLGGSGENNLDDNAHPHPQGQLPPHIEVFNQNNPPADTHLPKALDLP